PGALAVDYWRRTTEVQINRRDWIPLQFLRRPDQCGDIVADQLRYRWTARRIFRDRAQDWLLQVRSRMHPEIFREINIRPAVPAHQTPERQIRHILHRRQRQQRPWPSQ